MGAEPGIAVVLVTGPDEKTMTGIAETVVEQGLAACVTVFPGARSVYRWQGRVHSDPETFAIIKTTVAALSDLQAAVLAVHPYETPEWLVLPAESGSPAYLAWVRDSVTGGSS